MTDDWFSEYLYQIVSPRKFVPPELLDIYDHHPVTMFPPWDPFGALPLFDQSLAQRVADIRDIAQVLALSVALPSPLPFLGTLGRNV